MAVHSHGDTDIVISDYTDGVVTSSLVLGSVKAGDYGRYVCMATNGHGKVRFSPLADNSFYSYNVHTYLLLARLIILLHYNYNTALLCAFIKSQVILKPSISVL